MTYNSGTHIIRPGVYCGGLVITGTANVTFISGTYVMMPNGPTNNGLSINGSGNMNAAGVTFYNGAGSGSVSIANSGNATFVAPTSGTYAGVLLFQDPGNTTSAIVEGGNNPRFEGALYDPNAQLTIDNIGDDAAYTIIVAGSLVVSGDTNQLPNNYSSLANGSPIKDAVLVE